MSQAPPSVAPSGEDAILHHIDAQPRPLSDLASVSLDDAYEVDLTLHEILRGGYSRVALQFADEQLHDAVAVYRALRSRLPQDKELYVLADTTYGSCCVDEVAAQHVDADFVIHYGHTCLSPTARLPVLYVLTKRSIDPDAAASALASTSRDSLADEPPKAVVLLYDVAYAHKAHLVADALRPLLPPDLPLVLSHLDSRANLRAHASDKGKARADPLSSASTADTAPPHPAPEEEEEGDAAPAGFDLDPAVPAPPTTVPRSAGRYTLPDGVDKDECALLWIGGESLALNNVLLVHGRCRVWSYDPATGQARLESGRTNRMLMRRYATVEKAKDADVVGILVGTLGVAAYLPLITHLRQLITSRDKKSYTVAVGKLNPAKLANFIEVECWVLVACPENSMVDSKEFLRPIVTPFELELALTGKAWTGDYLLDFAALLESSTFGQDAGTVGSGEGEGEEQDEQGDDEDGERPVFSAATGTYRHPKRYTNKAFADADALTSAASALSIRDTSSAVSRVLGSAAGEYMQTRTYKGLEPRYGMDEPARLEMGREGGIARGYGYEKGEERDEEGGNEGTQ